MLDELILDTIEKEEMMNVLRKEVTNNKKIIEKELSKRKTYRHSIEKLGNTFEALRVERIYISYYADKLKEKLGKEKSNEVLDRQYIITDIDSLVKLLKNSGVEAKKFKKYLTIQEQVNKEKIRKLFEVGDITKEDLKGCYDAKLSVSVQLKKK